MGQDLQQQKNGFNQKMMKNSILSVLTRKFFLVFFHSDLCGGFRLDNPNDGRNWTLWKDLPRMG